MKLHPQLEKDSIFLADFKLSQIRMIPDGELTWFLLIPRRDQMIDWSDLELSDQKILCEEITALSELIKKHDSPDKINVASLGNMVPQLHIHIIARYKNDRAWPNPVWGTNSDKQFNEETIGLWKGRINS